MHAIGHFQSKIYWLFALTRFALGDLNAVSVLFFQIKLNIIVNILVKFDGFK